jgi:hypothetical protein
VRYGAVLALALAVPAGGCRQVLGIDDPTTIETPNQDASPADSPPPPPDAPIDGIPVQTGTCMQRWQLGSPVFASITHLNELDGGTADSPFLLSDELVVYYVRSGQILRSQRSSTGDPFSNPQPVGGLDSPGTNGKAYVNDNETRAFFASTHNMGVDHFDLFRGVASGSGGKSFSVDQQFVSTLDDGNSQIDPFLTSDLLTIYYAVGATSRIEVSTRMTINDNFGTPGLVANLPSLTGAESSPTLTPDQRVIVFATTRDGDADLYYATRATAQDDFSPPQRIDDLDIAGVADASPHISSDGCRVYFSSDRDGTRAIYVASMN